MRQTVNNPIEKYHPIPPPPIHPLSALVTLMLDHVFGVFEVVDPLVIIVTSVTVTAIGTLSTALIQHYLSQDTWGEAIAKGFAMGIIAGVPFSVTGTIFGVPLLAWAGLHKFVKLPSPRLDPVHSDQTTIEGEFKSL
jgi:hypothetical protein